MTYKIFFLHLSACAVNSSNSLPNLLVDVDAVRLFKARLGKCWLHRDVRHDHKVDLTGVGIRSAHEVIVVVLSTVHCMFFR